MNEDLEFKDIDEDDEEEVQNSRDPRDKELHDARLLQPTSG